MYTYLISDSILLMFEKIVVQPVALNLNLSHTIQTFHFKSDQITPFNNDVIG